KHWRRMGSDLSDQAPTIDIPQPDRIVVSSRGNCSPIRRKHHAFDARLVSAKQRYLPQGIDRPQPYSTLVISSHDEFAVRGNTDANQRRSAPIEMFPHLPVLRI